MRKTVYYQPGESLAGKDSSEAISTISLGGSGAVRGGEAKAQYSRLNPLKPRPASSSDRRREATTMKAAPAAAKISRCAGVNVSVRMVSSR